MGLLFQKDGCEQLLTYSLLNKLMSRRKTDPAWQDACYVLVFPFGDFSQLQRRYVRTYDYPASYGERLEVEAEYIDEAEARSIRSQHVEQKLASFDCSSIQDALTELSCYLELAAHVVVSQFTSEYAVKISPAGHEARLFFLGFTGWIHGALKREEKRLVHWRYRQLEGEHPLELAAEKERLDSSEEEELQKLICTMLGACIEERKIELKVGSLPKIPP